MGRVDKFMAKRKAAEGYVRKNKKGLEVVDKTPKSLKEMLDVKKKVVKEAPAA
ncbi:MAG: hypothetical protein UX08_C0025G0006 [Candidatus Collierbacteria bacterium GW2011_GWB1_45_35]|nr:MAG: hypothetical protein UX08_C0025G0006 [Candidatus Collierbacteria bacterium GW2011_GWB1_45_35]